MSMGYEKGKISHFDSTLAAAGFKQKSMFPSDRVLYFVLLRQVPKIEFQLL